MTPETDSCIEGKLGLENPITLFRFESLCTGLEGACLSRFVTVLKELEVGFVVVDRMNEKELY
jgi:hypothetical protein